MTIEPQPKSLDFDGSRSGANRPLRKEDLICSHSECLIDCVYGKTITPERVASAAAWLKNKCPSCKILKEAVPDCDDSEKHCVFCPLINDAFGAAMENKK